VRFRPRLLLAEYYTYVCCYYIGCHMLTEPNLGVGKRIIALCPPVNVFVHVITNQTTKCMEQSPSEANRSLVKKFPAFYLTQRFLYCIHEGPPLGPCLEPDQSSPCIPYNFLKRSVRRCRVLFLYVTSVTFIAQFSRTRGLERTKLSLLAELTVFYMHCSRTY
jgi:hypothetical protein